MTTIAIIPARGDSKGIPRKNLAPLCGKPLIAWSIEQARNAVEVDEVYVSTEDPEIKQEALEWGASVIDRPPELATDEAATDPVLVHTLQAIGRQPSQGDLIVLLQPTSPIRDPVLIDTCILRMRATQCDSLLTVCPGPIFTWRRTDHVSPMLDHLSPMSCPIEARTRRQAMGSQAIVWVETGSVYVTKADVLMKAGQRLHGSITCVEQNRYDAIQIDEPYDLVLAERRMRDLGWEEFRAVLHTPGKTFIITP